MGLFLEGIAIQVLTLPIVYPLITGLGFDGIWFAVVCYIIHGIDKSIPLEKIFLHVIPMLVGMIVLTIIFILFPSIITFLPNLMQY
jgi:TRAP-type C4-dicarboxylate transport system permease large subunit